MMDAIRVVVVINSTNQWVDLTLTLIGEHSGITVYEEVLMAFEDQENASLTYDSWAAGEHTLILEISDSDGRLLKSVNIGTFDLSPALATPEIDLVLSGSEIMQLEMIVKSLEISLMRPVQDGISKELAQLLELLSKCWTQTKYWIAATGPPGHMLSLKLIKMDWDRQLAIHWNLLS